MDYEAFFFISASSGKTLSNYHYIHSIKTTDLSTEIDSKEAEKAKKEGFEAFSYQGKDLLNMKGDPLKNTNLTMESYNRQLIRNTNIYSKLITQAVKNAEKMITLLQSVPKDFALVEVWRSAVELEALIDKASINVDKTLQDAKKKYEKIGKVSENAKKTEKSERFQDEMKKIENALLKVYE